jgi:hypothetical protein
VRRGLETAWILARIGVGFATEIGEGCVKVEAMVVSVEVWKAGMERVWVEEGKSDRRNSVSVRLRAKDICGQMNESKPSG